MVWDFATGWTFCKISTHRFVMLRSLVEKQQETSSTKCLFVFCFENNFGKDFQNET